MKSLKSLFTNLKSAALVVLLAGLILASGLIATKTLLHTGTSKESSGGSNINTSSGDPDVKVNSPDSGVSSGEPSVTSGNPNVTVWVNTNSGVYHCPHTRWYGNTKNGKYMTQKEA